MLGLKALHVEAPEAIMPHDSIIWSSKNSMGNIYIVCIVKSLRV
jgi:hypothetical protein